MDAKELQARQDRMQLVDLREPGEWQAGPPVAPPDGEQPGKVA